MREQSAEECEHRKHVGCSDNIVHMAFSPPPSQLIPLEARVQATFGLSMCVRSTDNVTPPSVDFSSSAPPLPRLAIPYLPYELRHLHGCRAFRRSHPGSRSTSRFPRCFETGEPSLFSHCSWCSLMIPRSLLTFQIWLINSCALHNRLAQKPGDELYANFRQAFPELGPPALASSSNMAAANPRSMSLGDVTSDTTMSTQPRYVQITGTRSVCAGD